MTFCLYEPIKLWHLANANDLTAWYIMSDRSKTSSLTLGRSLESSQLFSKSSLSDITWPGRPPPPLTPLCGPQTRCWRQERSACSCVREMMNSDKILSLSGKWAQRSALDNNPSATTKSTVRWARHWPPLTKHKPLCDPRTPPGSHPNFKCHYHCLLKLNLEPGAVSE